MKKTFILFSILFYSAGCLAGPNLKLLAKAEWKGACRKVVNEAGVETKVERWSFFFVNEGL